MKSRNNRLGARLFSNWHQKAIALVVSLFIYVFYRVSTQSELIVPLEVKRPAGYELSREAPAEATLVFRGAPNGMKLTDKDFRAVADLSGDTQGGTVRGAVKVEILNESLRRNPPDFDYSPSVVEFVLEPVAEKYVPVDVMGSLAGTLPPFYFFDSLTFTPQSALVRGPKSQLERVTKTEVESLDLTGKKDSFTIPLAVQTNNKFVRAVDPAEIKVSVVIKGRKTFGNVGLLLNGLRPELAAWDPATGSIEVTGSTQLIDGLKPEELSLAVDCREVAAPGEYSLAVAKPELPAALADEGMVTGWDPKEVKLRFERREKEGAR